MRRMILLRFCCVFCWLLTTVLFPLFSIYAETSETQLLNEIRVSLDSAQIPTQYTPELSISLLADDDDVLAQIEALREQSKAELEPLVKQYMYTAEELTQLALQQSDEQHTRQDKDRLLSVFATTEKNIQAVLKHYEAMIDSIIRRYTLRKVTDVSVCSESIPFKEIPPGTYRVYGVLTFATTALTWFEQIRIEGGGCHTVHFTRENRKNPYWTALDWWSFINLDFSKHH